MQFFTH